MDATETPEEAQLSTASFFAPLMISMAGIISTTFAIVLYHFIMVKYCRRRWRPEIPSSFLDARLAPSGVEQKVLKAIPIIIYSPTKDGGGGGGDSDGGGGGDGDGDIHEVEETECVVCLGELEDGDMIRLLPTCNHAFHVICIDTWFLAHTSCPVCRAPVVAPTVTTTIQVPPLPLGNGEEDSIDGVDLVTTDLLLPTGGDGTTSTSSPSLHRHCVSLVLPIEEKPRHLVTGLKRSLSLDQSYVILDIQRERERSTTTRSTTTTSSSSKGLTLSRSFLKSLSRLRMGGGTTTNGILPY